MTTADWIILAGFVVCIAVVLLVLRKEQREAERMGRELEVQLRRERRS